VQDALSRRQFLFSSVGAASVTWVATHWPDALAAAGYARHAARSAAAPKFEFFTPEQAAEIEAISARIIPTEGAPGAREAGVVYFIDRALKTFASDDQKIYLEGLPKLQERVRELFPGVDKFSAATPEQQDHILASLDEHTGALPLPFRPKLGVMNFFETVRQHTLAGFLIEPDSDRGGNRDGVGWKVIGREREHTFQPPFGYYDKDYRGLQPASEDSDKK
jgi:gluconate 2-dehydrogenase subunit 3-like protein